MIDVDAIAERVQVLWPTRSVCVRVETWVWFPRSMERETRLQVSFQPGLDGTKCSLHNFQTTEEVDKWVQHFEERFCTTATNTAVSEQGAGGLRSEDPTRAT